MLGFLSNMVVFVSLGVYVFRSCYIGWNESKTRKCSTRTWKTNSTWKESKRKVCFMFEVLCHIEKNSLSTFSNLLFVLIFIREQERKRKNKEKEKTEKRSKLSFGFEEEEDEEEDEEDDDDDGGDDGEELKKNIQKHEDDVSTSSSTFKSSFKSSLYISGVYTSISFPLGITW